MTLKPFLPTGFRDITPDAFQERKYILNILKEKFVTYGFCGLETPAMENLSTLLGKYGEEGEQLMFKILNSGPLGSLDTSNVCGVSKKGLRYDLTVPLARYVAQHRHMLPLPFKRYQIQPVWRAERAQKGRYREFYQCDVDVVGSDSLFYEASLLVLVYECLQALGITDFTIHLNHRRLLSSLVDYLGMLTDEKTFVYQILDKLDKVGQDAVVGMLSDRGFAEDGIARLQKIFKNNVEAFAELNRLEDILDVEADALSAIKDMRKILGYVEMLQQEVLRMITIRPTLARGISYYKGAIFEVTVHDAGIGSIVGGGRYDGLTDVFGMRDVAGVGLSFGLERIYDIMKDRNLLPDTITTMRGLMVPMTYKEEKVAIDYLVRLREENVLVEFFPAGNRIKKTLAYAHKRKIPWAVLIGEEEVTKGLLSLKDMRTGSQKLCTFASLVKTIRKIDNTSM